MNFSSYRNSEYHVQQIIVVQFTYSLGREVRNIRESGITLAAASYHPGLGPREKNKVVRQLNERPRETLQFETPAARINTCAASTD
jgi:IS30 family transposase